MNTGMDGWMVGAEPSRNREEPLTPSWLKVPVEMVSQVHPGEVNGLLGVHSQIRDSTSQHQGNFPSHTQTSLPKRALPGFGCSFVQPAALTKLNSDPLREVSVW